MCGADWHPGGVCGIPYGTFVKAQHIWRDVVARPARRQVVEAGRVSWRCQRHIDFVVLRRGGRLDPRVSFPVGHRQPDSRRGKGEPHGVQRFHSRVALCVLDCRVAGHQRHGRVARGAERDRESLQSYDAAAVCAADSDGGQFTAAARRGYRTQVSFLPGFFADEFRDHPLGPWPGLFLTVGGPGHTDCLRELLPCRHANC